MRSMQRKPYNGKELKEAFERSISRADAAAGGVGGGIGKEL